MIDEKKLIDKLKQSGMIADNDYGNAMVDMIENQPKIGGWIPCSERLPEKGITNPVTNDYVEYLCTVCVDGYRTVRLIKFDKDGCWVNHGMNFDKYVTAWQPLPEEYNGQMD